MTPENAQPTTHVLRVGDRIHYAAPGADRRKLRSTTYAGIGAAMAQQWGGRVAQEAVA